LSTWYEFAPGESGRIADIEWVVVENKNVQYSARGLQHTVPYVDDAAAQQAYDDFLLVVDPPVVPGDSLQVGDMVRVSYPTGTSGSHIRSRPMEIVSLPLLVTDPWVFRDDASTYFVFEPITVTKA